MKNMIFIYTSIIILILSSCVHQEKPQPVIPEDKLVHILKDIMIIEAGVNRAFDPKINKDSLASPYYQAVYKKYGVTFGQFNYSYKQYQKHPEYMDSLFVKVLDQLQIEQVQLEAKNRKLGK